MFRDVVGLVDIDVEGFFGDSAEDVEFEGDEIFDEFFESVSDGDDVAFLDVEGVLSFEEGFGDTGFVTDEGIDHFDFLTVSGFDFFGFDGYDFDVDVVSASDFFEISDFGEDGFSEFRGCRHVMVFNKRFY